MFQFVTVRWRRYALAVVAVFVGSVIASPIQRWAGGRIPFVTFFPLLTVVAALAGTGPGLVCTVLSAAVVGIVWMEPYGVVGLQKPGDGLALCIYCFAGCAISVVGGLLRRAQVRRDDTEGLLKAVLENTPGLFYMKDRRGELKMINRRFAELAGKPAHEIIGKTDREAFGDNAQVDLIQHHDRRVIEEDRAMELEEKMGLADGEHTYLSIKVPFEFGGEKLICGFTTDITERKLGEENDRFLVRLDDAVRPLTEPYEITQTAARLLGEHLKVNRCAYADVEADQDTFNLTGDYNNGVESIVGRYRFADFGAQVLELMRANRPYVVENIDTHEPRLADVGAYRLTRIQAVICVPLHKAGKFVAAMAVHQAQPRKWRANEVELVGKVAARCWESIERARIARDLRKNEEWLRLAQEAGGVGTFEFDVASGKSHGSEVFYRIFNAPAGSKEYSSEQWMEMIHPESRDETLASLNRAIGSPETMDCSGEYRIVMPQGQTRWVSYRGRITRDETGRALRIMGTVADVTSRALAQQEIRQSEARFRTLAEGAPVPISVSRLGRHLFVNAAYRRCFGLSESSEVVGTSILDQIAPEEHASVRENVRRRFTGGTARSSYEFTGLKADGSRFTLEVQVGQLELPDGPASIAFLTDITDRTRAEVRLKLLADAGMLLAGALRYEESLQGLARLVVPHLADWCALDMAEGGELRRVAVVHPDPQKVALAHDLHRRFPPDRNQPGGTWDVMRTGKTAIVPVITDEMLDAAVQDASHRAALRELKIRSYLGVPLVARGQVLGVMTLVYAESGRSYSMEDVALAEELARRAAVAVDNATLFEAERAARSESERASRLKDEFLATLSHELRTPLNAILGWSQLIDREGVDGETLRDGISAIVRNARAQTQLIEDLLDMSRIVSGKLRLEVQSLFPVDVINAAIESIRPGAEAKGLRIEKVLDPEAGPVSGDPGRLQQAIWNLLANAVKFTPRGGKIQVILERVNSHLEITVSDTGQGIAPEFLPHIFERFRQADGSTTRRHGGLGIGLALVKQLVELHGGSVRVKSPGVDSGATFIIALPVSIAVSGTRGEEAGGEKWMGTEPASASLAGVKVLVVDDEPDARMLAKRILEERGAVVTTAGSAREGLGYLRADPPDVLLSDIGMPVDDGYQFIAWVRSLSAKEGGRTPAAAFTAFARSEDRQRALFAGFHSHVVKPVEPSELIAVVASLAGRTGPVRTPLDLGKE